MRGVTVHEGDYVIADNCGTVFTPQAHIEDVLRLVEQIDHCERLMIEEVRAGKPVPEVMHDAKFEAIHAETLSVAAAAASNASSRESHGQSRTKPARSEDRELVALFAGLDTPAVSDALDRLGIAGQAFGIPPLTPTNESKVTVGPGFTVRYIPAGDPPGSVGDFIDDVAAGDVVVIDNGGRTDCTVWGDILTQYAGLRGIAGTVIDGVCRDVNLAINEGYSIFTAGRWMRTGKDRVQVGGVNEPVGLGQVHVAPRDLVVADANRVVIVPRERVREVT
jgi:regulator of RNase E activity RraA